jgi:transcriptional regulator with XRE-family HTH domain
MSTAKSKNSDFFVSTLTSLMQAGDLSKAQLAREMGVSNAHVANWLKGQIPNAENLLTISRFFKVTIEQMIAPDAASPAPLRKTEPSALNRARSSAEKLARQLGDAERTAKELRGFLGL